MPHIFRLADSTHRLRSHVAFLHCGRVAKEHRRLDDTRATQLTVMPLSARSRDRERVSPTNPALDDAYEVFP